MVTRGTTRIDLFPCNPSISLVGPFRDPSLEHIAWAVAELRAGEDTGKYTYIYIHTYT